MPSLAIWIVVWSFYTSQIFCFEEALLINDRRSEIIVIYYWKNQKLVHLSENYMHQSGGLCHSPFPRHNRVKIKSLVVCKNIIASFSTLFYILLFSTWLSLKAFLIKLSNWPINTLSFRPGGIVLKLVGTSILITINVIISPIQ